MGTSARIHFVGRNHDCQGRTFLSFAGAYAAPEADPQLLGHPGVLGPVVAPPVCDHTPDELEIQACTPYVENVCTTADVVSEEITYEKKCKTVTSRHCRRRRDAEADPQWYGHPLPVAAATVTVKHECADVDHEHCANVPVAVEVVTPVETCHAVTKVKCDAAKQPLPKVVCKDPEPVEVTVPAAYGYGLHGYGWGR